MPSLFRKLANLALGRRNEQQRQSAAAALAQRASDLRARAASSSSSAAAAAAAALTPAEVRELAGIEGVYLGPGRSRSARFYGDDLELAPGLVARLGRPGGRYFFLGRDGRFYASETHALGRGAGLVTADDHVPYGVEALASVYRYLLCG